MAEVKYISSPAEIPAGQNYVLIMQGNENGNARHSRGLTITIARGESDDISKAALMATVNSAEEIADLEGISTVFVCA